MTGDGAGDDQAVEAVGLLAEPVRRALYRYVVSAPAEVGRDEAAEAVECSRSLAAFHLDKLVAAGLLAVTYRRRAGRSGPGAGRPAKLYRQADREHTVSLPPREYLAAARLLADVVDEAGLEPHLHRAARRAGAAAAADGPGGVLTELLAAHGYQPYRDGAGVLRLRNCPFDTLAREFPPLICGANLALVEGMLAGLAERVPQAEARWVARLEPRPGECCVALASKTSQP